MYYIGSWSFFIYFLFCMVKRQLSFKWLKLDLKAEPMINNEKTFTHRSCIVCNNLLTESWHLNRNSKSCRIELNLRRLSIKSIMNTERVQSQGFVVFNFLHTYFLLLTTYRKQKVIYTERVQLIQSPFIGISMNFFNGPNLSDSSLHL